MTFLKPLVHIACCRRPEGPGELLCVGGCWEISDQAQEAWAAALPFLQAQRLHQECPHSPHPFRLSLLGTGHRCGKGTGLGCSRPAQSREACTLDRPQGVPGQGRALLLQFVLKVIPARHFSWQTPAFPLGPGQGVGGGASPQTPRLHP